MHRSLCMTSVVLMLSAVVVGTVSADVVILSDVPSYLWYRGCGPTAQGMVIGYWDAQGYANLIPGSSDWDVNSAGVKDAIASPGHIRDYVPTPDRVETTEDPYHESDCLADFSHC